MEFTLHTGVMGHNSYGGHISYWGHGVILQMWVMVTQHTRLIYISYSIFGGSWGHEITVNLVVMGLQYIFGMRYIEYSKDI